MIDLHMHSTFSDAHPGLLSEEEAMLARKNGVLLEITARMQANARELVER